MAEAIDQAEHDVFVQIYECNSGDGAAQRVMDALWQRALRALDSDAAPLGIRVLVSRTW